MSVAILDERKLAKRGQASLGLLEHRVADERGVDKSGASFVFLSLLFNSVLWRNGRSSG